MKNKILLFAVLLFSGQAYSQTTNDTIWKKGLFVSATFNQVSFSNWAAGGENSISMNGFVNTFANYKKGNVEIGRAHV